MTGLVLLSLLAVGGLAFAFDMGGGDDEKEAEPDRPEEEPEFATPPYGDGDDMADLTEFALTEGPVYTGAGDDTITAGIAAEAHGGSGDDSLVGLPAASLYGDAGDDVIAMDLTAELNDGPGRISGGDGDETITVRTDVSSDFPDFSSVFVDGGPGADDINLDLELGENLYFGDLPGAASEIDTNSGILVEGFEKGQDTLSIDVERAPGSEDRDLASSELLARERTLGDGTVQSFQTLEMVFEGSDTAPEVTTSIDIYSDEPLELGDIEINLTTMAAPNTLPGGVVLGT